MTRRVIHVTADEAAAVLRRRRSQFPGFVAAPERQAAGLAQLREHLSEDHLRGDLLSATQLVERAIRRADALEREVTEREREVLRLRPPEERFADAPLTRRLLGLAEPPTPERPASRLDGIELGEAMRRVLGRPRVP